MAASSFFLTGTITRRIFTVFFLFALTPVCLFSYLAITRLSEATDEQISQMLENEASNLSYLVLERLSFVEKILSVQAATLGSGPRSKEDLAKQLNQSDTLAIQIMEASALGSALTDEVRGQLDKGSSAIVNAGTPGNPVALVMLKQVETGTQTSLLVAELTENLVLSPAEARNLGIESCVLSSGGVLFYATDKQQCEEFRATIGASLGHKGELVFGNESQYFSRYRALFMGQRFASTDWVVAVIQPRRDLFLSAIDFRRTFIAIALGALLSLSLVSIYFIRTRMAPLATIMAGIERVSAKQYDQPVEVNSGDEFQQLAEAFNDMSHRVSRQIDTMASMADIDQLMLSRQSMDNVIPAVLDKAKSILPCESVGLAVLSSKEDPDNGVIQEIFPGRLYVKGDNGAMPPRVHEMAISAAWSSTLKLQPIWLCRSDPGEASQFFAHFASNIEALYLLPLRREGRLAGAVLIGFAERPEHDEETSTVASSLADRISVALTNAEWEDKLFHQAHFDALTGLPNRQSMQDHLEHAIGQSRRSGKSFSVSFIDLDDFKLVNDALGHMAGDEMIEIIAQRLKACVRAADIVSRMGGDEFVMISEAFDSEGNAVMAMGRIAEKIIDTIARPLDIGGREIRASASIGVSIFPRDGSDSDTLLKNADSAMYAAKAQGRGRFHFFSERLNEESVALMNMSSDMKRALERSEFELYYQPKVDLHSGQLVGAEALIRWNHPERGLVSQASLFRLPSVWA